MLIITYYNNIISINNKNKQINKIPCILNSNNYINCDNYIPLSLIYNIEDNYTSSEQFKLTLLNQIIEIITNDDKNNTNLLIFKKKIKTKTNLWYKKNNTYYTSNNKLIT
jgi:hypothetical protein